jgi:hypothetical protein
MISRWRIGFGVCLALAAAATARAQPPPGIASFELSGGA